MTREMAKKWILAIAAATPVVGMAPLVGAQHEVTQDGRALDANNRIGSGGYNDGGTSVPRGITGNQIITGNVTGGREFRDDPGYRDQHEFRGETAGESSDQFIRGSAGIPSQQSGETRAWESRPFYGQSRAVAPPPGYVQLGRTGGFVPATADYDESRATGFGAALQPVLPRPGQLMMPGPVDPTTNQQSLYMASPLFGMREMSLDAARMEQDMARSLGRSFDSSRPSFDAATLERMRGELLSPGSSSSGATDAVGQPQSSGMSRAMGTPAEGASPQAIGPQGLAQRDVDRGGAAAVVTGQSVRNQLILPADQQSAQLAELRKRFDQQGTPSDADAARQFNEERQLVATQDGKAQGGLVGLPGSTPELSLPPDRSRPGIAAPGGQATEPDEAEAPVQAPETAPAGEPDSKSPSGLDIIDYSQQEQSPAIKEAGPGGRPLQIKSLAAGVEAKGLSELLKGAEDALKEGKYSLALDYYNTAGQVAPNNAMVTLGKAHVELAAAYYARAEARLREAFAKDPSLLMGQYDLRVFLPEDRLQFVVNDLKEIANKEQGEARPVFLLAYIAYNTGSERRAGEYLNLAATRAGGEDSIYVLLRRHWAIPPATD